MPEVTLPLDDLTQQIVQRESELERLRQQYETRQARLAELARQREELQAQLRQVDADIQAVTRGHAADAATRAAPATSPKPSTKPAARPTLADVLVDLVRQASRPLTARELGEELARRAFPTTSGNITNLVQNRLTELVQRGVFRRAPGQPGVLLAKPAGGAKAPAPRVASGTPAAPAKKTAPPSRPGRRKDQPSLRSLLTDLLRKSRKPVAARDLAQQVLATGYQTKSKDFIGVVWTALGQMEAVENVKGEGWRLSES